jgi:hypothetical protein
MRVRTQTLLVVAALLGTAAAPARGQDAAVDPRWLAFLGCWEQVGVAKSTVCVVPTAERSAVDLVTIVKGEVTSRERIATAGARVGTTRDNCAGWRSAAWSARGQRVYLRSEDACSGEPARTGTGLIAMSGNGRLLYIRSMTIGAQTGVHVQRYREAPADLLLPADVADALRLGVSETIQARAGAGAPLATDDVIEASRSVDVAVIEAWLVERAEPFMLDAKRLIALADAGVASRVIDLMVALSYPRAFAINTALRQGERLATKPSDSGAGPISAISTYNPLCSSSYFIYPYSYFMSPYSSYDCSGLGYGYGYGLYPGGYPVTIVYLGSGGGSSRPHGRVVNGEGYAKGPDAGTAQALPRPSDSWSQPSGGSSSGSTGTHTSTSSSGSTEQRTAKPRPPQ